MGAALKIHQPSKEVKPKQTLVSLIRKLRPLLPGKVVKGGSTNYIIEGKVLVEFYYYCTWEERQSTFSGSSKKSGDEKLAAAVKEKAKQCHPSYIKVSFVKEYLQNAVNSSRWVPQATSVFKARVHNPGKGGEFALEKVATSVTRCIEAVDEAVTKRLASDDKNKQFRKLKKTEGLALEKVLPKRFKREWHSCDTQYVVEVNEESCHDERVNVVVDSDDLTVTYSYTFNNLTLSQVKTLLKVGQEIKE